jgi:SAM-dependent methyltransferase
MDYSMLAHVLAACGEAGATPEVTVVDVCDTPLFLNHWFARRAGLHVQSFRSDVLDFPASGMFDVTCSHALLGQFSPDRRRGLMAKWRQLLKPGGRAITVNRIRPGSGSGPLSLAPEQARALREAVLREARQWHEPLGVDPEALAAGAERNALAERTYPVSSRDEFAGLFEDAGFEIEHLSFEEIAARNPAGVSGPRIPGGAEYGRIVARRP